MSTLHESFFLENSRSPSAVRSCGFRGMLCKPRKLGVTPSGVPGWVPLSIPELCIPRGRRMGLALVTEAGWQRLVPNFHADGLRPRRREGQELFAGRGSAFQSAVCVSVVKCPGGTISSVNTSFFILQLARCSSTLREIFPLNLALFLSVWNYL